MVTALYAGPLTLLLVVLAIRVIGLRRRLRVSIGDGADQLLARAIRTHANCAEYAPIGLLLILLCEVQGLPLPLLHVLGASLLAGRVSHAIGLAPQGDRIPFRAAGMILTFAVLICAALAAFVLALMAAT